MSAYFIDIDGVLFRYGTMEPNIGAVEYVNELFRQKNEVFLVTKRVYLNNKPKYLNLYLTEKVLDSLNVNFTKIIEDVSSPRYLINDEGAFAVNHERDKPLNYLESKIIRDRSIVRRVQDALEIMAWELIKYQDALDADEYIQTMSVAHSLIEQGGFNHRDLVKRYKEKIQFIYKGKKISFEPGGVKKDYKGQIYKLNLSTDPLYTAKNGVSDGAAMKVIPIAAYYLFDFEQLITNTDKITTITHGSIEARLSAILVVLRFRQILLGVNLTPEHLLKDFERAIVILKFGKKSAFFLDLVIKAKKITEKAKNSENLLFELSKEIGLDYLAWSTPISACFWSFKADSSYYKFYNPDADNDLTLKKYKIDYKTLKSTVFKKYENHLFDIGEHDSHMSSHSYHWKKKIDVDTFISIAFSLIAAEYGVNEIEEEIRYSRREFAAELPDISYKLIHKKAYLFQDRMHDELNFIRKNIWTPKELLRHFYQNLHLNLGIKTYFNKFS